MLRCLQDICLCLYFHRKGNCQALFFVVLCNTKTLSQKRIDVTMFLPTPRVITASGLLKSLPPTTKSYPFLSQSDLQGNDSCPENLYVIAIFNYKLEFIKERTSTFRTLAISFNCATEGCDFVTPKRYRIFCFANYLFVRPLLICENYFDSIFSLFFR